MYIKHVFYYVALEIRHIFLMNFNSSLEKASKCIIIDFTQLLTELAVQYKAFTVIEWQTLDFVYY